MKGQIISQRHMNANSNENALRTFNKSALKPLDKLQPNSWVMGVLVHSDEGPHPFPRCIIKIFNHPAFIYIAMLQFVNNQEMFLKLVIWPTGLLLTIKTWLQFCWELVTLITRNYAACPQLRSILRYWPMFTIQTCAFILKSLDLIDSRTSWT